MLFFMQCFSECGWHAAALRMARRASHAGYVRVLDLVMTRTTLDNPAESSIPDPLLFPIANQPDQV